MIIDFAQPILDLQGEPMIDDSRRLKDVLNEAIESLERGDSQAARDALRGTLSEEHRLTLGKVAARALTNDRQMTADQKMDAGLLALRIFDAGEPIALKAEQITLVKGAIKRGYNALVVVRAFSLLDPAEKPTDAK